MDPISILWLFIILASLQPVLQQRLLERARRRALARLASERGSTVVTLIHRQETMSFLGFPIVRYINIDDSEEVLSAIRATPAGTPIDIILHTPGGLVLAASQIASALAEHDGPVSAIIPPLRHEWWHPYRTGRRRDKRRPPRSFGSGGPATRRVPGGLHYSRGRTSEG